MAVQYLLQNATADGTYNAVLFNGRNSGADLHFSGIFDGASLQVQVNISDNAGNALGEWVNIGDPITEPTSKRIELTQYKLLRVVVASAGGSTDINAILHYE